MSQHPEHDGTADVVADDVVAVMARLVGAQLQHARTGHKLGQDRLADLAGVSNATIYRVESAERDARLVTLVAVSVALRIRLSDVLRIAEDSAQWRPAAVWNEHPDRYLGSRVVQDARDVRRLERVGYRVDCLGANDTGFDPMLLVVHCVGLLVRRARERQHMQLEDVRRHSGFSCAALSRLELSREHTTLARLLTVCLILGVRPSDVVRLAEDHVFPTLVWSDLPRSADIVALSRSHTARPATDRPVDLMLPEWAVPVYSTGVALTELDARRAARDRAARCAAQYGHDDSLSAEISVELRDGVPVDIWRCVRCGQPVPLTPPSDSLPAAIADEVTS